MSINSSFDRDVRNSADWEFPKSVDTTTLMAEARALQRQAIEEMFAALGQSIRNGFAALGRAWQRRRALAELRALDDRMLADIGLQRDTLESQIAALEAEQTGVASVHPAASLAAQIQFDASFSHGSRPVPADRAA